MRRKRPKMRSRIREIAHRRRKRGGGGGGWRSTRSRRRSSMKRRKRREVAKSPGHNGTASMTEAATRE